MKFSLHFPTLLFATFFLPIIPVFCETYTLPETLPQTYTSYRRYPFCTPSYYMRYPSSVDDVIAIVNEAIKYGVKVKAFGARHSQTDIICTEGIPVDMNKFKSCSMNEDGITATFGPGVTVREAGEFLFKYERSLRTTPAFGNITLGGAIGTGAHGSTIKYTSTISAQVVKLTVVDGLGQVIVISDAEDLKSFRIHLGLLGIVVDITLSTVPLYKVYSHTYVVPDDILTNGVAVDWAQTTDQITFYWFPAFQEVVVSNLTFVPANVTGNAYGISLSTYGYYNFIGSKAMEIAYKLATSDCTAASSLGNKIARTFELASLSSMCVPTFSGETPTNPAVGYPHMMLTTVCSEDNAGYSGTACFWAHGDINSNITGLDNEFGIALSNLSDFVEATKDIVRKTPTVFPLGGIFMRFSGKSNIHMSTAYGRDTTHIELYLWQRKNSYNDASGSLAGYQTILQTLTKRFMGRSHWGKSGLVYHSSEMLKLKLEDFPRREFVAAMKKYDPNGIFLNNFGRRITEIDNKIDFDPSSTRCALLDNCFCSEDKDCGASQICGSIPGYDYRVCRTKNEVPDSLSKNDLPQSLNDALSWLNNTVPMLADSVMNICSLLG